jgi:hypothetical protein
LLSVTIFPRKDFWMVLRKTSTAVVLAMLFLLLFAVPSAYASTTRQRNANPDLASSPAAPIHPSASCPQPDRHQDISTLTQKERLDEGYPMPINKFGQVDVVNGKTDPHVDQFIHDKGVHFCADTDVQSPVGTSFTTPGSSESNNRIWSGNYADGGNNYTYVQMFWTESCTAFGTNDWYSTWAGIGGIGNTNLVQAGVYGYNTNAVNHGYEAWIQNTAVNNTSTVVFSSSCGDYMGVEIGTGNCMIVFDETNGDSSGWRCTGPNANSSTAECIVEAPVFPGNIITELSNYNSETLTACQVEINAGSNQKINNVSHD